MRLQPNQIVELNGRTYRIRAYLGGGAVSNVYLAVLETGKTLIELVIKVACEQQNIDLVSGVGITAEAATLNLLNRVEDDQWAGLTTDPAVRARHAHESAHARVIIALLDSGVGLDRQPFVIRELAPPPFRPFPIRNLDDERRTLQVAAAVARALEICHSCGLTLRDFDPRGEKADRIRVAWQGQELEHVKIIDWNVTGGPDAPLEEKIRDLRFFGSHLYLFLFGHHLPLDEASMRLPLEETTSNWKRITHGSRLILGRLLHHEPHYRYNSASELYSDLAWWVETLEMSTTAELRRRAAQSHNRPDRSRATADLALRLDLPASDRAFFQKLSQQAFLDMQKPLRRRLNEGIARLRGGLYSRAIDEFDSLHTDPAISDELAYQVRVYRSQALLGFWLQNQPGASGRFHAQIDLAIAALVQQDWRAARDALEQIARSQPALGAAPAFSQLYHLAEAGLLLAQANRKLEQPRKIAESYTSLESWMADQLYRLRERVALLQRVTEELAPEEPMFRLAYKEARAQLEQNERQHTIYRQAAALMQRIDIVLAQADGTKGGDGDFSGQEYAEIDRALGATIDQLRTSLERGTDTYWARQIQEQLQATRDEIGERLVATDQRLHGDKLARELLDEAINALCQGEYARAADCAQQVRALPSANETADEIYHAAQEGLEQTRLVQWTIGQVQAQLSQRDPKNIELLNKLYKEIDNALAKRGSALLKAIKTPLMADVNRFVIADERPLMRLRTLIEIVRRTYGQFQTDLNVQRQRAVIATLENLQYELQSFGYDLNEHERTHLNDAKNQVDQIHRAEQLLKRAETDLAASIRERVDWLRQAHNLTDRAGEEVKTLREYIQRVWLTLVRQESDAERLRELLRSGSTISAPALFSVELRQLVDIVAERDRIKKQLRPADSGRLVWLDERHPDTRLRGLLRQFESLYNRRAWLAPVSIWLDELTRQLLGYLDAYIAHVCDTMLQQTQLRKFDDADRAIRLARQVLAELPKTAPEQDTKQQSGPTFLQHLVTLASYQHVAELRSRVDSTEQTLKRSYSLYQPLIEILTMCARGELSFADAAHRSRAIVLPKDVIIRYNDIADAQSSLETLAGIESTLPLPLEPEPALLQRLHTQEHDLSEARETIRNIIEMSGTRIRPALTQCIDTLSARLRRELTNAAERLRELLEKSRWHPGDTPADGDTSADLLRRYWTARWLEANGNLDLQAVERIVRARNIVRQRLVTIVEHVMGRFAGLHSYNELVRLQKVLDNLYRINSALVQHPETIELVKTAALPHEPSPLNQDALQRWLTIVHQIGQLASEPDPPPTMLNYPTQKVRETRLAFGELHDQLEYLRSTIWPALVPPEKIDAAGDIQLEDELARLDAVAIWLEQIYARYEGGQVIEALRVFYDDFHHFERLETSLSQILLPQHRLFKQSKMLIQIDLDQAYVGYINQSLHLDYRDAVVALRKLLLESAHVEPLAKRAIQVIAESIQQEVSIVPELHKQQTTHRTLWNIVRQAAELPADTESYTAPAAALCQHISEIAQAQLQSSSATVELLPTKKLTVAVNTQPTQTWLTIAIDWRVATVFGLLLILLVCSSLMQIITWLFVGGS